MDATIARPTRFLIRTLLFLVAVGGVCWFLKDGLIEAFQHHLPLNSVILAVLALGILFNARQIVSLNAEIAWIEMFRANRPALSDAKPPRLLAPMVKMLGERTGRFSLSPVSMRSLLDSIGSRMDESRDLSRYFVGLLIFLGLLGTFWGLLQTVSAVSGVIATLSASTDVGSLFADLQNGLKAPLKGMGTAFGTSLFGLASSIVLGFCDLQAGQAQNRFYNDLEEWLSAQTRLSSGTIGSGEGGDTVPAYIQALLETTADNLESLQRTITRSEEGRNAANQANMALADRLGSLADQMKAEQQLLLKLAEGQIELRTAITKLADVPRAAGGGVDEATRMHIRNMDAALSRMVEEASTGRLQLTQDIRNEIRLLARTIANLAEEPRS
ncbi:MAG: flagellar motor protein MotA [Alphaproteobacteria bacterium]|nr:flagellar motor protein MotA [Alphaproteobacteria bacterium]